MRSFIKIVLIVFTLAPTLNVNAQFITLPDPAFANFIATTFPAAVNASNQLDTNVAKTISGNFICTQKNINDVYGIQYFENISRLELSANNLTSIPDISKLSALTYFKVDSNQLTSLPPLNGLSNLQKLYCRKNKLTSIPPLTGMNNLTTFFCDNNQLTTLPDMTGCTLLYHIIGSDNKLTSLPDLSTLTSLNRFLLTNNLLTSVDLSMIPSLQEVSLKYNRLTTFPDITGLTQLTQLWVDLNKIDSIPDLSSYTNLTDFKISNNRLTFEDLIPLTSHPNFSGFAITPQYKVGVTDSTQLKTGDTLNLFVGVDTSLSGNTYYWYKDGVLISSGASYELTIDSLLLSDNGIYTYEIRNNNPALSSVVLTSNPIKVSVLSCFDASQLMVTIAKNECKDPIEINIDEQTLYGGVSPFSYTLTNITNGNNYSSDTSYITLPSEGIFDLVIKDNIGCEVTLQSKISISRGTGCEPVFYPDMSGPGSGYYIETSGTARIYSKEGKLIRTLQTPAVWDGKNSEGETMNTGVYMIIVNEQVRIQVSLIRTH